MWCSCYSMFLYNQFFLQLCLHTNSSIALTGLPDSSNTLFNGSAYVIWGITSRVGKRTLDSFFEKKITPVLLSVIPPFCLFVCLCGVFWSFLQNGSKVSNFLHKCRGQYCPLKAHLLSQIKFLEKFLITDYRGLRVQKRYFFAFIFLIFAWF